MIAYSLQAPSRRTVTPAVHQRDIAGYEGLPLIVKFRYLIEFLIYSHKLYYIVENFEKTAAQLERDTKRNG